MQNPNHFAKAPCDGDMEAPYKKHRWITVGTNKVCSHCDLLKVYALQIRRDAKKKVEFLLDEMTVEEQRTQNAAINAPPHYIEGRAYEPVDVIEDWGLSYFLGTVVKYVSRAGRKGPALPDLLKANFYLKREIKRARAHEAKG